MASHIGISGAGGSHMGHIGGTVSHPVGGGTELTGQGGVGWNHGHVGGEVGGGVIFHPDPSTSVGIGGTVSSGGHVGAGITITHTFGSAGVFGAGF